MRLFELADSADERCVSQWQRSELEAANSLKIDCGGDQSAKVRMLKSDEAIEWGSDALALQE